MRAERYGGAARKYALTSDEDDSDVWGFAHEAAGLFTPAAGDEGARRVHLTGCLPQGGLLESVGHIGGRRARTGARGDGATR